MNVKSLALAVACLTLTGAASASAQTQTQTAPPPAPMAANNYADHANWLCWPGATPNACHTDLSTTIVRFDGGLELEPFKADPKPTIDCFYVYPTVSTDPGILATMKVEREETTVITQQFARFGASCRTFAPLYRQFTLTALVAAMQGKPLPGSTGTRPTTPYQDVADAWNYYLAHENHGRGVVLIGHSQGSGVLTQLIKNEIDGKPAQARLVSAILMGTSLSVPKDADVGGDFKSVPLCHSTTQLGCVIVFASFRDTTPPPESSRFGRPHTPRDNLVAACVNPANLTGGPGQLNPYLASGTQMIAASIQPAVEWVKGKSITTPFVRVPGLLTANCVSTPRFNYLSVHVNADPQGTRTQTINGDVVLNGKVQADWGLHMIDANLTMGNLVRIVGEEARAWGAAKH